MVNALALMDDRFCDEVARGTYGNGGAPPSCEDEVRTLMGEISQIYEIQMNIRINVRAVRLIRHNFGCEIEDSDPVFILANDECARRIEADGVEYGLCPYFSGCPQGWVTERVDVDYWTGRRIGHRTTRRGGSAIQGGLCGRRGNRAATMSRHDTPVFYTAAHEIGHLFGAIHSTGEDHTRGFMKAGAAGVMKLLPGGRFFFGFSDESLDQMCARVEEIKVGEYGGCLYPDPTAWSMESASGEAAFGSPSILETTENLLETTESLSEAPENLSETSENVSKTSENLSETTENLSKATENVSKTTGNLSETSENVSKSENLSETSENLSKATENISETTENLSETSENLI